MSATDPIDPNIQRMRNPGFDGVDPNKFDDPKVQKVVAMVVGADGKPASFGSGGGGGTGGSASDPDSSREATQLRVLQAVQALAPLLGSTDGLEALAATNRDLLTNLGQYTDGLEDLLTLLNTNTDGIESLLSALGVNDQNVIGKLEALRLLLSGTLTTQRATQLTISSPLTIPGGASISDGVNLTGRSLIRLTIGAAWTAADITVQTSPDGATWNDLYDEYGTPYTIKAAANRTVFINPGPLLAVNYIRLRSGTPAAPVNQASAATITLASVAL